MKDLNTLEYRSFIYLFIYSSAFKSLQKDLNALEYKT